MTPSLPQAADCEALQLVLKQAEDVGLWFKAETAAEAYLQQELRRLHAAIEADRLASQVDAGTAQAEAPGWQIECSNDLIQITAPHGGRWCLIRDDDKTKIGSFLFDYFAAQVKAGAPQPAGEAEPVATSAYLVLNMSREQVSALYLHLCHRETMEYGWMEAPLKAIEKELELPHTKIHAIVALESKVRELEKDAARYRWLREPHYIEFPVAVFPSIPWVVRCELKGLPVTLACNGVALDAAIDTALAAQKPEASNGR